MRRLVLLVIGLFLVSCSSTVVNVQVRPKEGPTFVVLPFENHTETPFAGLRVASIAEGVASSKGYNLKKVSLPYEQKEYTTEDLKKLLKELQNSNEADYAITGSVNEYRYKAGIDGEPAVSITLKVYSIKSQRVVYTATASKSGWYYQSVSTLAQRIINRILPDGTVRFSD
ncbi:MAG: hypothetical protein N3C13_05370 [Aquificaceae bacterium]|nr:hypothetical protein [Aquificaceae bacterium]MCX8060610.1 hypothetical protein [Aquificaceae bacterium]MDW8096762.1 hypothetical protein [Aquificaceae bacterium]